jgi:nitrogen fixation/metabolism regulation signal transduction histidine kinase
LNLIPQHAHGLGAAAGLIRQRVAQALGATQPVHWPEVERARAAAGALAGIGAAALAGIFALVGVLPGALIYTVSYQFVSRSLEAWFDVRLAGALDAGLSLGKETLDTLRQDAAAKARVGAERLAR